jgi:hypothetical protein
MTLAPLNVNRITKKHDAIGRTFASKGFFLGLNDG